ncbi:MAG: DUF1287 domain-containing protein [Bacillota bacterium]|jgi:uncharacterized protein YijF (DUF1287 family)
MDKKKKIMRITILFAAAALFAAVWFLHPFPPRTWDSDDFGIAPFVSAHDKDRDGIDDQTDILKSARAYLETKPTYKSRYYVGGYPDDGCGVCTDVVAFALKGAGYDLRDAVAEDRREHPENYGGGPDRDIDFRRVANLKVFFAAHALPLTTDTKEIEAWQGGDIVIWEKHIGVVSDRRGKNGVPLVLHHARPFPFQLRYEEDILENYGEILGHYRIDADLF